MFILGHLTKVVQNCKKRVIENLLCIMGGINRNYWLDGKY
jgi:hypothetical protein